MGCGAPSKLAVDDDIKKPNANGSRSRPDPPANAASSPTKSGTANGQPASSSRDVAGRRRSYRRTNSEGSSTSNKKGRRHKANGSSPNTSTHAKGVSSASANGSSSNALNNSFQSIPAHANNAKFMSKDDPHWMALWETFASKLLDPTDVHAALDDLMSQTINKLSPTELTFLQRRTREIVRSLPKAKSSNSNGATKRMGRLLNGAGSNIAGNNDANDKETNGMYQFANATDSEARIVADRHQLLTAAVIKRALPALPIDASPSCNPIENAYILMLFMNDAIWDTVASIAKEDTAEAGLEMDVNKIIKLPADAMQQARPAPSMPLNEPFEFPQGVTFSSFAFIVALGLRGSRTQRLQLLFYLLLPPEKLLDFLQAHPAGGVPTWLLEVGSSTVVSISSLSHYHLYGDVFLPGRTRTPNIPSTTAAAASSSNPRNNGSGTSASLCVRARDANEVLQSILKSKPKQKPSTAMANGSKALSPHAGASSPFNGKDGPQSPIRKASSLGLMRRGSNHKESNNGDKDGSSGGSYNFPKSEVMDRLQNTVVVAGGDSGINTNPKSTDDAAAAGDGGDYSNKEALSPYSEGISIDLEGHWKKLMEKNGPNADGSITMGQFCQLAEAALDDVALDVIMDRLFASGTLPDRQLELDLVTKRWQKWQELEGSLWLQAQPQGALEMITQSVQKMMRQNGEATNNKKGNSQDSPPFGGIGGIDGLGAMGFGIMYVIDRKWWDKWTRFVGWTWAGDTVPSSSSSTTSPATRRQVVRQRPGEISTEALLDRETYDAVPGTMGSYEKMRDGLRKGVDFVLVPPSVWNILYEVYGGGPPLPRVVAPFEEKSLTLAQNLCSPSDNNGNIELKIAPSGDDLDAMASTTTTDAGRVVRIPKHLNVYTHPWVLHVHLCDPQQPYRRGDAGPMSIRVMVLPDQPLWRFYAELVVRLPFHLYRSFNNTGRGRARLWKRIEPTSPKDAMARYGPWALLCKNRFAVLPVQNMQTEISEKYDELKENWMAYADNASVESVDIEDGDQLMIECAVATRNGEFMWPREAAAKAGREKRLAEGELKFRQMLRGADLSGKKLPNPPELVGTSIDAMDPSGRWYQVDIEKVQVVTDETDEEDDDENSIEPEDPVPSSSASEERKQILVDFTDHGGHDEWIDIESDRLAPAGRFTLGKQDDAQEQQGKTANGNEKDSKLKNTAQVKKLSVDPNETNGRVCTLPGYGACGLSNLGNTCYINSAIQCMSYMPLLRSYLLSSQYKAKGDLNKDNPLGTGGKLLEEFAELLRQMWAAKYGEKSPGRFRSQLGKACSQFSGADQQDAQEYLNYMMDVLHEDSNKVQKKPYVEGLEDEWVENSSLRRVGDEAWRRFLRRNRSIMADVAMGQVLSTVTCPVCHFSSRNFDPFNLLSVPFPTVASVIFQCYVVRRASAVNTPWVLNKPRKGSKWRTRFVRRDLVKDPKPPSEQYIIEQYVIAMSRLADSGDLRLQLQNLCGISANQLKLCRAEEIIVKDKDDGTVVRRHTKVSPLTDKEGPCSQFVRGRGNGDDVTAQSGPAMIVAFETTLRPRPIEIQKDQDEEESSDSLGADPEEEEKKVSPSRREVTELERHIEVYGNAEECRVYDTPTISIAKAISRSIWPRTEDELKLGLRVDAIDHRDHWFPGSVVEIIENNKSDENDKADGSGVNTKVRVHFDNYSSKWDETYSIDHFMEGRVQPLYSHASPRAKPTEFAVHHRFTDRTSRLSNLFGQSFYVQCYNDWSTARAGAQILGQASRFLRLSMDKGGPIDKSETPERQAKVTRLYERTQAVISDLIDLLIDVDREYVQYALGVAPDPNANPSMKVERFRNPGFDATAISASLVQQVNGLIHRLPFEVRVCTIDATLGGRSDEEVAFPFSLMRTIGNYMNVRHAVVLQWREPPTDKKASNGKSSSYLNAPVMYVSPKVAIDQISAKILHDANEKKKQQAKSMSGGGMKLGVCLTEFCKVQQLSINDNWRCPRCRDFREGRQNLELWRLPDLLTFHIKRFNCSARWREKISTKVNFPLTGLDMTEWCHKESPVQQQGGPGDDYVYDLVGVLNHYGSMTGGHYVATCKATACGRDGFEEVAHDFNGVGVSKPVIPEEDSDNQTMWRIGRPKAEANQSKLTAASASKAAAESSEPLWLQFDDDLVEPIPPQNVVSEMAYVLFYRRRRMAPSNIAKYSTLE